MSYSTEYFTARESWRDWRIEAQWLIDQARAVPGSTILEIGCGGGGLLRMVQQRGAIAVGVDTLSVALELARRRDVALQRLYAIHIGETTTLPFCAESFDSIIAQHALEHLPDVDAALREWKRLLKPNGRIVVATPNALYPDPAHFADDDHAHVFAPDELRETVQRAGLRVESCHTIFPYLSRVRALRAFGVIAYRLFQSAPYFSSHGRTIQLCARNA